MRETHNGQSIPAGLTEWRSESLKSITTLMTNGFVGIATPFYVAKGGVPYFMANNVRANELDPKDHTLVSHEFHKRSARSRLRPGDILRDLDNNGGVFAKRAMVWFWPSIDLYEFTQCISVTRDHGDHY
ncbi:MAG: hypothetical protein K1X67_17070, partial [Fimbriimonadaceae bacterium]|nr:hypothetical protein [Fimbriimonadaceae bacterium]